MPGTGRALWVEVERIDEAPVSDETSELAREYRAVVENILLSRGILIAENVTGLGTIANQRVEFAFLALNIEESDGAPARVLARPIQEQTGAG